MKAQHPDKRMICCNCIFLTELEYDVHVGRRHTFKDSQSQFPCHLCQTPFKNTSLLVIHLTMDHHNTEPIKCEPCNILFDVNHKLDLHIRKVHKTNAEGEERIFCDKCPRIERTTYYNDQLSFDWHYVKKHVIISEEGNYACHRCPQLFTKKASLQVHIKVDHHNVESNMCQECGMMFALPSRLETHIKEMHTEGPQFSCEFCGKKFNRRKTLSNHRARLHRDKIPSTSRSDKIPYSLFCDQCGKGYRHPNELRIHTIRAHTTGEFPCDGCGTVFTNPYSLRDHKREKHRGEKLPQAKKQICQYCGMKFTSKLKRDQHEKSVHLGIRDYMCDQCDYRTANAYKLRMHKEAIHEGIVYKCDVPGCGRSYRTKGSLYCHQDKNHDIPKPKTIEKMKKRLALAMGTSTVKSSNCPGSQEDTRVNDQ